MILLFYCTGVGNVKGVWPQNIVDPVHSATTPTLPLKFFVYNEDVRIRLWLLQVKMSRPKLKQ